MQLRLPAEPQETKGVVYTKPWVVDLILDLVGYRPGADLAAMVAVEPVDGEAAAWARELVVAELTEAGVARREAERAAAGWVVEGDYLLSSTTAPRADVIIGNPPYIRYDDLPQGVFASYRAVCPTMVGRCDIYVGFIEAALEQLKPGGRLGYICADRWMRSAYGNQL